MLMKKWVSKVSSDTLFWEKTKNEVHYQKNDFKNSWSAKAQKLSW